MKILSVILARGGSKGIPKKNLSLLGDKPLVVHMIEKCLNVSKRYEMDVILSSDSDEIIDISKTAGAWVPFKRPKELALDSSESIDAVKHAIKEAESILNKTYNLIIYAQPTSPLCRESDFFKCIDALINDKNLESCVPITSVSTHPFKMKRMLNDDRIINFIDQGFEDMRGRQTLPKVYKRAGSIYVSRRDVVMYKNTLVGDPCKGIIVPNSTAIDIDRIEDLELARIFYEKLNLKKDE
tara:strand:- start:53553 stop:54272 length:720 start_codon:yes stop_codon:yes gene_type:complete